MSSATNAGSSTPSLKHQIGNSASLLDALDAASKWSAFLLLSATFILSLLSLALLGAVTAYFATKSQYLAAFSGLITFLVVSAISIVGVNATGILLSDDVWGRKQRTVMEAVLASALTCHRLIAVLFIEFLLFLCFLVVLALLLLICKIPGIGPVLYALVLPVGAIATGVVIFSLIYIAIPLAAPAVWNGASVKHTLLMLQAVARKRLLTTVTMMVLLGLLTILAVGFVWAILAMGTGTVFSLSSIVLGVGSGGIGNVMNIFADGGSSGYVYAMGLGGAVLLLVGANPGFLIGLKGASIIYREVSAGLSLEDDERELNRRIEEVKAHADRVRQQAAAAAQQAAPAPAPAYVAAAASLAPTATCPACKTFITPDDVFCGSCGHKLM